MRDPERALAVLHTPAAARPALLTLFRLDERLGGIVSAASQPMIGQMRLAWWREALERLDNGPAPAEPLLRDIAAHILPRGVTGAELSEIEDGWAALLDGEADAAAIARHGRERGGRLFAIGARLIGAEDARAEALGTGWALADLGHRATGDATRREARAQARALFATMRGGRWPRAVRPLAMLAVLARGDAATEGERRQGAPGRLMRMLALRLLGI